MSFRIVIPARYHSTRLEGKLLRIIADKPLLQYTYEQAISCGAKSVVIATDHADIADAATGWGATVCMTDAAHQSGTDRLAEVAEKLAYADSDIIVNVQGDEPLLPPTLIQQVAQNLQEHTQAAVATLCETISDSTLLFNPNVVKVVYDKDGYALYFSRAPIAWDRDNFTDIDITRATSHSLAANTYYRHIGLYAYRASFLKHYHCLPECQLETLEKLEQLRVLWNGYKIHVGISCEAHMPGVDTLDDLERVRQYLEAG